MVKKTKKEKPEVVPEEKEKLPEAKPERVNVEKITELAGQIEDVKTYLRIGQQLDIHRAGGAQVLLEKLENELASYK